MIVDLHLPEGVDLAPPYVMFVFLPGRKEWWFAGAWSDESAMGEVLDEMRGRDPRLAEAFVAFADERGRHSDVPHLRLVVPPRDQEPPEPLF